MSGHTFVHCEDKACGYHKNGRCIAIRIQLRIDPDLGLYCDTELDYELDGDPFTDENYAYDILGKLV